MRLIDAYIERPKRRLFHYTNSAGLVGITKDRKLWATHILHLNDASEYRESISRVREEVERIESASTREGTQRLLLALDGVLIAEDMNVFVTSFSERGNVLSQWRAYSGSGAGYSIGFDPLQLDYLAAHPESTFVQCIYQEDRQRRLITAIAEALLDLFRDEHTADMYLWQQIRYPEFLKTVRFIAAIKHSGFREEREWRLIRIDEEGTSVRFRSGRFGLTPYLECALAESVGVPTRIAQLYVGPCAEARVALRTATYFAHHNLQIDGTETRGLRPEENVQSCDLPYRP